MTNQQKKFIISQLKKQEDFTEVEIACAESDIESLIEAVAKSEGYDY